MHSEQQFLNIQDPDYNQYTIKLESDCFTIGRSKENDIVLPNSEKTISRQQCILKCEDNSWWVVDELSANGTFVQRENSITLIDVRQDGELRLKNGDSILILGKWLEGNEPAFWRLCFRDDSDTSNLE